MLSERCSQATPTYLRKVMTMQPDFDRAATKAIEVLIANQISETPVDSLSILLKYPGVRVMSFKNFATQAGMHRHDLIPLFGENQDAATFNLDMDINDVQYVVVYNMRLPYEIIWRGIARELGHIVLGHNGVTRPPEVRLAEAVCFDPAWHGSEPRRSDPERKLVQEAGICRGSSGRKLNKRIPV